jgi:F-type H+-transporting ATPase subunit epsilon
MSDMLHLAISTPAAVLVDMDDVTAVRADDESGSFGILPGHTDFLTVLPASVVRWQTRDSVLRFCALRGGVMTVSRGYRVAIACRRGSTGDDLATLEHEVEALHAAELDAERRSRVEQMRLHTRAVRQLMRFLRPGGRAPVGRFTIEGDVP